MKTVNLLLVDDEADICELLKDFIEESMPHVACTAFTHWRDVPEDLNHVDVVITDSHGVGEAKVSDHRVIRCSGDFESRPDIDKPINFDLLISKIENIIINNRTRA